MPKEWQDKKPRPHTQARAHNPSEQVCTAVASSLDKTRCSLVVESREVLSLEQVLLAVGPAVSVMEWPLLAVHSLANQHKMRPSHRKLDKLEAGKFPALKSLTLEEVSLSALRVSLEALELAQARPSGVLVEWVAHLMILTPTSISI